MKLNARKIIFINENVFKNYRFFKKTIISLFRFLSLKLQFVLFKPSFFKTTPLLLDKAKNRTKIFRFLDRFSKRLTTLFYHNKKFNFG